MIWSTSYNVLNMLVLLVLDIKSEEMGVQIHMISYRNWRTPNPAPFSGTEGVIYV